jgi:multicomponent Na+:H+ antiporter subunit A
VRRLVVLDVSVKLIFHVVLIASVYLLLAGHNQPGGGFVGGLLVGAAVAMRYAAGGIEAIRAVTRFRPWTILGAGLLVAAITAVTPVVLGHTVLEGSIASVDVPAIGTVKVTSALFFDVGVYLLVVGLALMVFEAFGDDPALDAGEGSRA